MPDLNKLASLLRDSVQGASNAVASNVTFPVDALAWLLRKGGLPIPDNPVGGSNWAAQQGLTAEPQNRLAGLIGEGIGSAAPFAMAAKAPQIARGLLAADDAITPVVGRNVDRYMERIGGKAHAIDPAEYGLPVNKDGTVSLFHGTTKQGADNAIKSGALKSAGEPDVYLTNAKNAGYGDGTLLQVDVDPRRLFIDDEFPGGRYDFRLPAPSKSAPVKNPRLSK